MVLWVIRFSKRNQLKMVVRPATCKSIGRFDKRQVVMQQAALLSWIGLSVWFYAYCKLQGFKINCIGYNDFGALEEILCLKKVLSGQNVLQDGFIDLDD